MHSTFIRSLAAATAIAAFASPATTQAADRDFANHLYGGISLGGSRFDASDDNGSVFKVYGGYQLTENFSAEMGYLRTGDIERAAGIAKSRAFYSAGTARWQFGDRFAVSGMLGVAYGEVVDDTAIGAANLDDDNLSVMVGFGAQYRLSPRTELTFNIDHLGKQTERVSTDIVTAGLVMRF